MRADAAVGREPRCRSLQTRTRAPVGSGTTRRSGTSSSRARVPAASSSVLSSLLSSVSSSAGVLGVVLGGVLVDCGGFGCGHAGRVRQATRAPASPASAGPVFVVVAWMTSDRGGWSNVHGWVATDDPRPSARVVMSSQTSFCGLA